MMRSCSWFAIVLFVGIARGEIYFSEEFPTPDAKKEWVESSHHGEDTKGSWSISASKYWKDGNLGLKTDTDARFYAISKKIPTPFSNKDQTLVVQYIVKFEETVSCGGSYLKLIGPDLDQSKFHGDSPYLFMFGPDICGYSTKKVHAIFNYKGKNNLIKKEVRCKDDKLSHLYTFILTPDNKYEILIDNEQVEHGNLEDDWDMLAPKMIDDPSAKKPEDWVDEEEIVDPNDKKPEDWDKPKTIPDPNAKKPEDWDDEMDGEWERPQIDNPEYKGEWEPKKIPNPNYKGPWVAPKIANPEYQPDNELYLMKDISYVGFDLWQVTSGSIFDNILITNDPAVAKSQGDKIWRPRFDAETEFERLEKEAAKDTTEDKQSEEDKNAETNDDKEDESKEDADESKEDSNESTEDPAESKEETEKTHEEL